MNEKNSLKSLEKPSMSYSIVQRPKTSVEYFKNKRKSTSKNDDYSCSNVHVKHNKNYMMFKVIKNQHFKSSYKAYYK